MNKYFIFIFFFSLFTNSIFSQVDTSKNESHFSIKIKNNQKKNNQESDEKKWTSKLMMNTDFSLLIGATQFFGDIKQFDNLPAYEENINFWEIKPSIELSLTKKLSQLISLQGTAIIGRFGGIRRSKEGLGNNVFVPYPHLPYQGEGEYFTTDYKELDLQLLLNLSNVLSFFSSEININNYTFYLKSGIGLNAFHSANRNLVSGDLISAFGYVDETTPDGGKIKMNVFEAPKESVYIFGFITTYELNDKFSLRLDVTKRIGRTDKWDASLSGLSNTVASEYDNFNFYAIGASYNIGEKKSNEDWITPLEGLQNSLNESAANIEWLSGDSDHDGVSDAFDKDPNTPMGVSVDGSGSPLDVDMDNIPDYLDADPFSSRDAIVDKNGVEFDSDNDGVPDSKDLESNTEIGSIVNQYGITVSSEKNSSFVGYFPSIYFETGSYYINEFNLKRIATVAMIMRNNPNIRLKVIGNTDKSGNRESNEKLAINRAQQVINYLSENFSINKNRFITQSNGSEKPLSNNIDSSKELGKTTLAKINRRVDFEIIR